jgi:hypothetical protein
MQSESIKWHQFRIIHRHTHRNVTLHIFLFCTFGHESLFNLLRQLALRDIAGLLTDLVDFLLNVVVELAKYASRQAFQVNGLLHGFLELISLFSDLIVAQIDLLLQALHISTEVTNRVGFLMPRSSLN